METIKNYTGADVVLANAIRTARNNKGAPMPQTHANATAEIIRLKSLYENERDTVDRVWKALGISTYDEAGGKAIWELVAELKRKHR